MYHEHGRFLLERVVDFLAPGISAGEAAVVIATSKHNDAIDSELYSRGVDLASARRDGRFVSLDAVHTMNEFFVGDLPDRRRFVSVVGGVIESARLRATTPVVRAFGEMAAVLWAQGRIAAALALEDVWNDLLGNHPFSLVCGQPLPGLSEAGLKPIDGATQLERSPAPANED